MSAYRFLIVKLSAIGDVVHTLPALMDLRYHFPGSEIDWIAEPGAAELLRNSGMLTQVIEVSTQNWRRSPISPTTWKEIGSTIWGLRGRRYHAALDFQGLSKSALLARLSGAAEVLGIGTSDLRDPFARIFYARQAKPAGLTHRIERNRALLNLLGIFPVGPAVYPDKLWSEQDRQRVQSLLTTIPQNFIVVNPGGGWATKLWSAARFGELARFIHDYYGYAIVCTWGPGEETLIETLQKHARPVPVVPVTLSIAEFACFVRYSHMFIGGDTGPMHIAAAYGVPVFSIFGPTTVEMNGPYRTQHRVVQHLLPCSHCYLRSCWHHSCMRYLETGEVWRAFQQFEQKLSADITSRKSLLEGRLL